MTEKTADELRAERVEKYKEEYLKTGSIYVQTQAEDFGRDLIKQRVEVSRLTREQAEAIDKYNEMLERKDACIALLTAEAAGEIDFENHGLKGEPEKDFDELEEVAEAVQEPSTLADLENDIELEEEPSETTVTRDTEADAVECREDSYQSNIISK